MVNITVLEQNGQIFGFKYNGHAGYAEYGEDIVCSALTAQIMMTINGITEILKIPADIKQNDGGKLEFIVSKENAAIESVQILLKTLELGINTIMIEYGKFITLSKEEV